MSLKIGDKVGNKIYAGPHYGLQSPASYEKLKSEGAFKFGAQQIRSGSQLLSKLYSRLPKAVKDAVNTYSTALSKSQQAQSKLEESIINQGGVYGQQLQLRRGAVQRDQELIQKLSDKSNVDPLLVSAGIETGKAVIDARVGASMAKSSLTGALKQSKAPVVRAAGPNPINSSRIKQALERAKQTRNTTGGRAYPDSAPVNSSIRGRILSGTGNSKEQAMIKRNRGSISLDARESVRRASDSQALAKAQAAFEQSPTPKLNPPNKDSGVYDEDSVFIQGTRRGDTGRKPNPYPGEVSSRGIDFKGETGVRTKKRKRQFVPGGTAPAPRIKRSKLRELAEEKRQRNLLRDKAQRKALQRYSDSGGTHPAFSSHKGKDIKTYSAADEAFDTLDDYTGDRFQEGKVSSPLDRGIQYQDGEVKREGGGKRGARPVLSTNIQLQKIGKALKVKDFHVLPPSRRKQILIDQLKSSGVDTDSLTPYELKSALRKFVKDTMLSDEQVRTSTNRYTSEREFPEQFNQLEAQERGGLEIPSPSQASRIRERMAAQRKRGKDNRTLRERILGVAEKHQTGVLKPKAGDKKYPKLGQRTDNVVGGRRIKQSQATYKERIARARARARAKDMATVPAKSGSTRSGYATNVDRAMQARRQKSKSKLPQAGNTKAYTPNKDGSVDEIRELYPQQDAQFIDAPDPDSARYAQGSTRQLFNSVEEVQSSQRGALKKRESKQRTKRTKVFDGSSKGLKGDNKRNSSIKQKLAAKKREAELAGDIEPDINKAAPKKDTKEIRPKYRRFKGKKGDDGKVKYDLNKDGQKVEIAVKKNASEVGTAARWKDGGKQSTAGKSERLPGGSASPTPLPRATTSNRARQILEQEAIAQGLDPNVVTTSQVRAKARELVAESKQQKQQKSDLQRRFNQQIAPKRNRSPQDELVNPNPFQADGELRSATVVSRKGQDLGVNKVRVEDYGASPRDPAGPGRSTDNYKKVLNAKGEFVRYELDIWKRQSTPDAIATQIQALSNLALEKKVDGNPTKRALKAFKMLKEMGADPQQLEMKPLRQRSLERSVRSLNQQRAASQRQRVDQGRIRALSLREKLEGKQPESLRGRKSSIKDRLKRIKNLRGNF